jgi:hypothetical protein
LSTITDTTPGSVEGRLVTEDDAEPIPVSLVASRIPGEFPGDTYHVCVIEDLRQKRALEAERRRAARQKELLIMAAEWAHDVRTPLTGILHSSELLAGAVDPRSPKLRHFRVIQSEVRRINDLVDHFLDYARPVQLRRAAGDLTAIAREVVDLLAGPATHRGTDLRLAVERGAETCPCELDRDAMKQVTLNLVSNALDAAGEGGHVTVRVARRADARTGRRAAGRGRRAGGARRVRRPAVRSLLHHQVRWHGARPGHLREDRARARRRSPLSARERYDDPAGDRARRGPLRSFTRRGPGRHGHPRPPASERMTMARKKVLICDDQETIRKSLGEALADDGYEIDEAGDGTTALDRVRDWVVLYFHDGGHGEGQRTVVTEHRGELAGRRVVRGRETECRALAHDEAEHEGAAP